MNEFIDSLSTDSGKGFKFLRTGTYPKQEYLDVDLMIDKREEFENLFRQNLVAFSKKKEDLPKEFLYYTGEKMADGTYKKWTTNGDDVDRFISIGILTRIILEVKEKEVLKNGERVNESFVTIKEVRPMIVR